MKIYYFDNSATSNPKPESVYDAVNFAIRECNANPGRGGHQLAVKSALEIYRVREKMAKFFNIENPLQIAFTNNSTTALNIGIFGTLKEGDKAVTTAYEHNSTLRPLFTLKDERGVEVILVDNEEPEDEIIELLKKGDIRMVAVNHMSNVTGKTLDIEKIGKICREMGTLFLVDASQSAGMIDVDVKKMNIDILCLTGHKSLYGIQGIGAIYVREGVEIKSLIVGGTGSHSRVLRQPKEMPEHLEAGTVNTPGIFSIGAGIDYINSVGLDKIHEHEQVLKIRFIDGIRKIDEGKKIKLYTSYGKNDGPVVSLTIDGVPSSDVAAYLDEEFGIIVRSGLHCAPLVHERAKTAEKGMVRFSFGYFNTLDEIDYAIEAMRKVLENI